MSIPLPNLDDRRWSDLVEEGRALIPFYAPDWTDHNAHDPGITLIELLAWIAEMDLYQLNRIPALHRWKFLALVGIQPTPPQPAHTVLCLMPTANATSLGLPAKVEFAGKNHLNQSVIFRSEAPVTVVSSQLRSIQVEHAQKFRDLSLRLQRGESIPLLGDDPVPGTTVYFGFDQSLPLGTPVSLWFAFAGSHANQQERQRLIQETMARKTTSQAPSTLVSCQENGPSASVSPEALIHHSVRTVWEYWSLLGGWETLNPWEAQVEDTTRSFTLSGPVVVTLPSTMAAQQLGAVESAQFYLRCRVLTGAYEAAPVLQSLALNGVSAKQVTALVSQLTIAPQATITGPIPTAGDRANLRLTLNSDREISHLHFLPLDGDLPEFRILSCRPGTLILEAVLLGVGTGEPLQRYVIPDAPMVASSLRLFTQEQEQWHEWIWQSDLDASNRHDPHFLLDASSGEIQFGDGEKGRVPPPGAGIFAIAHTTHGDMGNLRSGTIQQLIDSDHNRALLPNFEQIKAQLASITNPLPTTGGAAAESLSAAVGRALDRLEHPQRVVTLADYEALALETPGVQLARVSARANLDPRLPCVQATGVITLLILPYLPLNQPMPSLGMRHAILAYLTQRRVVGTRIEVAAPTYRQVTVQATVQAYPGINLTNLQHQITAALNTFFHPLNGGPAGTGWPFGRDVYRSEILHIIDSTPGVDHVLSLSLTPDGGTPVCSNLCLGPNGLVAAGEHEITVVGLDLSTDRKARPNRLNSWQ